MKKQFLMTVLSLIPAVGFAKVSDFNAMIADNVKVQRELHATVRNNVGEARGGVAYENMRQRIVVVEKSGVSYHSPTKKDLLAYKKEKSYHRASEGKQFERLANEIRSQND